MTVYSYTLRSTSMLKTEGTDTLLSIVSVIGLVEEENAKKEKAAANRAPGIGGRGRGRGGRDGGRGGGRGSGDFGGRGRGGGRDGAGRAAEAGGAVEVENNDTFFLARRGEVLGLPPLKS